jgi:secreted trypsin-like serine protease
LIDKYWALTAAHCRDIGALVPGQTQVRASSVNNTSGYESVGLAEVHVHAGYDPNTSVNDIALIKFQHPVQHMQPLQMSGTSPAINSTGKMAGWGWICEDASNPDCNHPASILQELSVKIVNDSTCGWLFDPQNQLCGIAANGQNAMGCIGDSGGPLVRKGVNNALILVGVTVGDGDFDVDHPNPCASNVNGGQGTGVWTDTSKYRQWTIDTMHGITVRANSASDHRADGELKREW